MRILDKYILKEFLGPFLFGVAAFTAIFLGADTLLKIADYVTKYGASSTAALKIFILALPRIQITFNFNIDNLFIFPIRPWHHILIKSHRT